MAQFNYDTHWKKVQELDGKGLLRSALLELDVISENAAKQQNEVQLLKTYIYRIKYVANLETEKNEKDKNVSWKTQTFSPTARAIMKSLQGETLQRYLEDNRFQLYERTDIKGDTSTDVSTWSEARLHREITAAYEASLQDIPALKKVDISKYEDILQAGKGNGRKLRPTLYDLVAHRALDYYKSGESQITSPENQFELTDPAAFATADVFMQHKFATTDSASLQYKALLLLQDLMRFHAKDKTALLDLDLERTTYMNQVGVMPDKEALYVKLLKAQEKAYEGEKEMTQVLSQLAYYYFNEGNKKDATVAEGMTPAAAMQLAKTLCEKAIALAPVSVGGASCFDLLQGIKGEALRLETELVNLPDMPFRTLVTYRNTDKIYLRVVRIDEAFRNSLREAQEDYRDTTNKYWRSIVGKQPLKTWEQAMTGSADFREHAAEIKIDALPLGLYMVIASVNKDFSLRENLLAIQFIHVSNISYILREYNEDDITSRYYTLHRQTGQPLPGTKLTVWGHNESGRASKLTQLQTYTANKDGVIDVNWDNKRQNVRLEWKNGEDQLFIDDFKYVYNYKYQQQSNELKDQHNSFIFTDRAIYRPGQTLYFKGIALTANPGGAKSKVMPGLKTKVELYDVNGELVDTLTVTTNEYGAYSGKFTLPTGRLNGEFHLQETGGIAYTAFQVEEYKRPKFYVEFEPVKGTYRVNDSVKVTGKALAYAGNNIDGAQVQYRVTRRARFPYPWLMWRMPFQSESREIVHGEVKTAADGTFSITFPALPDLKVPAALKPVFSYAVSATVTDINGETHSGDQMVSAGYQALEIKLNLPGTVLQKDLDSVKIITQNLNGSFEAAEVAVSVSPVKPPARLLRSRYWAKPDQFVIPQEAYEKAFPHDIYNDEDNNESWIREQAVLTQSVTTSEKGNVHLAKEKLAAGWYELKASTKDKYGEEVVQKQVFEVVDLSEKKLSYPVYVWKYADAKPVEPGEKKQIRIGSSATDVHVLQLLTQSEKKEAFSSFNINGTIENRDYTALESDRGNAVFQYAFVKDNRVYTLAETVNVPWSNKQLDVTIASHRDKLLPGEKEKWQVKIKGYKGEQVAAEMVASMFDASLDEFRRQDWSVPSVMPELYAFRFWTAEDNFKRTMSINRDDITRKSRPELPAFAYDDLNWFGWYLSGAYLLLDDKEVSIVGYSEGIRRRMYGKLSGARPGAVMAEAAVSKALPAPAPAMVKADMEVVDAKKVASLEQTGGAKAEDSAKALDQNGSGISKPADNIQPRKNFNETAFFLPELHTDKDGNISFDFTVPEALTRWRFLSLAHTKDAAFGMAETSIVTQKPLMVQPNAPRFMREGDRMEFSAKISNLADSTLKGEARLELLDARTMQPVDGWFQNLFPVQHFTVEKGQSTAVSFPVQIPFNFNSSLVYRVVAQSGIYSDGEENALPVLTNSTLVTETLPLSMRGDGTRTFTMPKLLKSGDSETLQQHSFTLEFSGNPAWYAVQALPYLMEYPYECSEQIFNRFYANTLATYIVNALPGVKNIFEKWRTTDTSALQSNLQKNEELKAVLLQETPWVLEAKNESEQKKRIALLFDLQRMSSEQQRAVNQLVERQMGNGAFPWFNGMWEDRYITQYIIAGFGRLREVGALKNEDEARSMITKGLNYIDRAIDVTYRSLKQDKADMNAQWIGYIEAHYLYTRSLFKGEEVAGAYREAYLYYLAQAKKYWMKMDVYPQAMLAIALKKGGDVKTATEIINSLKERAINNDELGMTWKELRGGYWWYQAPVESQAMLIAAFKEVTNDTTAVGDMKTWLLKNKQTNNWNTTKATADACYAMLLGGSNWLAATPEIDIKAGSVTVSSEKEKTEAGTGYFKKRFNTNEVKPAMGNIAVTVKGSKGQPSWGAVYWQYFEQLDKITSAETPLKLEKQLFIERNTANGPVLTTIEDGNSLKVGDKVKVRIVMKSDRDMEYIHLKDMRAACFEPQNVISESKWQNGVSYYESTKDASTNFFFSSLRKGTYVFEYTLFVTHQGNFSNGITTAQCMYAPEFSAHSEGIRVKVVE
ncbi:alpha-2-macroglobulin family protein [Chitinophaga ginsengisoli]|uniref:MG2 domain-containing protein n=1 Tax=Chitinophaga ginsengisoli TaxID=363837 RepID=A0A2P8GPW4_9BACT|nr:alpha-2-macroglobulin family protein [Chitinophaga ginsengisoli]PSL36007.1 MG2 domain-containing protein [Chitinophaga ginsengisoli]